MKLEPIVFVESTRAEEHPQLEFVAIEFKSGDQFYSFCLPELLAEKLYETLTPIIGKILIKRKKKDANMEATPRATDQSAAE